MLQCGPALPMSNQIPPPLAELPSFIYGTAWKEDRTRELVSNALDAGFRAVDTANQRKHYFEAAVGEAVEAFVESGKMTRPQLFLQSKFTYVDSQDRRLPYHPAAPPAQQVQQSLASSLEHLRTTYLDSYLLHGPSRRHGLTARDWEVWRAMEALHGEAKVARLGISNVTSDQLKMLVRDCRTQPAFVQNRCYARLGWDAEVRAVCRDRGIVYQGFSLLTANQSELAHPHVTRIAGDKQRTAEQVIFRFAMQVGMIPLTGTSSRVHMKADLDSASFELSQSELEAIERVSFA